MTYKNNIWKMYFIIFFHNLIPAYVIERLFWEQRGMTVEMVVYAEIVYAITVVILEIPTGIIADRWERKNMLLIGAVLAAIEFIILIYSYTFFSFAIVMILAGLGKACVSGSFNALLYDSLIICKRNHEFEKILGRINVLDFIAATLAAISGSFMASITGLEVNYWISLVSSIIALVLTFTLKEAKIEETYNMEEKLDLLKHIKVSISFFKSHVNVFYMITLSVTIGACVVYLDEFWQIYLNRINYPIALFGIVSAIFCISRIPGNIIAFKLIDKFKESTIMLWIISITIVGFMMVALFQSYIGIIAMIIIYLITGIMDPLVSGYIHHRADSNMRATIDSFQSLGMRGACALVGILFGKISTDISIFSGFGFLALVCFLLLIIVINPMRHIQKNH